MLNLLKEASIESIKKLPDECTAEDIMYEVNFIAQVLEGSGIYARVKGGDIRKKKQGLKMEMMVDSSSQSAPSPLKIPEKFKVSPGYYVLPFSLPYIL